jgi:hypothetical protein
MNNGIAAYIDSRMRVLARDEISVEIVYITSAEDVTCFKSMKDFS